MNGVLIAAALLTAQAATPRGDDFGIHSLVEVPNPYPGMRTFDLLVDYRAFDSFFVAGDLAASVTNGRFYDHPAPNGSDTAPDPTRFTLDPMLEFDTFVSTPDVFPSSNAYDPSQFGMPPQQDLGVSSDGERLGNVFGDADATTGFSWYDSIPPTAQAGVIARISILGGVDSVMTVRGTTADWRTQLVIPFTLTVPEPMAGVLLFLPACLRRALKRT